MNQTKLLPKLNTKGNTLRQLNDKQEEKKKMWDMTVGNHKYYEEIGNATANKHLVHKYKFNMYLR